MDGCEADDYPSELRVEMDAGDDGPREPGASLWRPGVDPRALAHEPDGLPASVLVAHAAEAALASALRAAAAPWPCPAGAALPVQSGSPPAVGPAACQQPRPCVSDQHMMGQRLGQWRATASVFGFQPVARAPVPAELPAAALPVCHDHSAFGPPLHVVAPPRDAVAVHALQERVAVAAPAQFEQADAWQSDSDDEVLLQAAFRAE